LNSEHINSNAGTLIHSTAAEAVMALAIFNFFGSENVFYSVGVLTSASSASGNEPVSPKSSMSRDCGYKSRLCFFEIGDFDMLMDDWASVGLLNQFYSFTKSLNYIKNYSA